MPPNAELNKQQFNKQAETFATWSLQRDVVVSEGTANFIGVTPTDTLLDVACGSGSFVQYVSQRIASAIGIDIAERQIGIAIQKAAEMGIGNASFVCGSVEMLPFADNSFSVVSSKAAFHHFANTQTVFTEMYRCCKPGGLICINDIITYDDDPEATRIIDTMDSLIDISHYRRMSSAELSELFSKMGMPVLRTKTIDFERSVIGYRQHALQDQESIKQIDILLHDVVEHARAPRYIYKKDEEIMFVNRGFLILGRKCNNQ